ncbi:MAG: M28 family peptidase [Actinobacteria bacterium]|nr:M28 family peptidase [Actinomycetota bacterium]
MPPSLLTRDELRDRVERLAGLERGSCSDGERRGADMIAEELRELGLSPASETELAQGTYWWPIGVPCAAAAAAGVVGGAAGIAVGALAAGAVADDIKAGPRVLRRALPQRTTVNVWAEVGEPGAERTLVFMAHHDAAHTGAVFEPSAPRRVLGALPPAIRNRINTTPPTMWAGFAAPLAVAAGSLLRRRGLRLAGAAIAAGYAAAMADIGRSEVVPAANDNATGVAALLSVARALAADPPAGLRVILLFPGAEESFMEGMVAWGRRHFHTLPRESTTFICLDTVGSPDLLLLEGEGMLGIREYPKDLLALVRSCIEEVGAHDVPNLRFRNATDGLIPLKAGYPTAVVGSVDEFKLPTNYHWPTDTPDRVDYGTVESAARACHRLVERMSASPSQHDRARTDPHVVAPT